MLTTLATAAAVFSASGLLPDPVHGFAFHSYTFCPQIREKRELIDYWINWDLFFLFPWLCLQFILRKLLIHSQREMKRWRKYSLVRIFSSGKPWAGNRKCDSFDGRYDSDLLEGFSHLFTLAANSTVSASTVDRQKQTLTHDNSQPQLLNRPGQ